MIYSEWEQIQIMEDNSIVSIFDHRYQKIHGKTIDSIELGLVKALAETEFKSFVIYPILTLQ